MVLLQALVRVFIFILIAAVITILSQMNKEGQEQLQKKEALFRGVFDTMPSGSAIYGVTAAGASDADYLIKDINSTALGYEQREKSDVIGRTLTDDHLVIHDSNLVPRLLETQKSTRPVSYQAEVRRGDGTVGYYDTCLFRLPIGEVVSIYTDVTDKRLMEEELKASEEKFRLAMEATSDGLWDWNMLTGVVYFSPAFASILDEDHIEPVYESWESRIHPADKERTLASLNEHISGKTSHWRIETRLKRSDESWKWVMDRGSVVAWDETGRPARMIGSIVDISEQKRIEEVIRIERDRAEQYLNIAEVMIVALSHDGTVVLINRKGAEMLGGSVDDIIGQDWFDSFVPPDMRESVRETFISLMDGADEMYSSSENEIITRGGKRILISWVNTIIKTPVGQIIGTLSSGEDLTMRKELEKETTSLLD
nr:PAS domain S-box protein [uncultured Methanospirillum sp.]